MSVLFQGRIFSSSAILRTDGETTATSRPTKVPPRKKSAAEPTAISEIRDESENVPYLSYIACKPKRNFLQLRLGRTFQERPRLRMPAMRATSRRALQKGKRKQRKRRRKRRRQFSVLGQVMRHLTLRIFHKSLSMSLWRKFARSTVRVHRVQTKSQ